MRKCQPDFCFSNTAASSISCWARVRKPESNVSDASQSFGLSSFDALGMADLNHFKLSGRPEDCKIFLHCFDSCRPEAVINAIFVTLSRKFVMLQARSVAIGAPSTNFMGSVIEALDSSDRNSKLADYGSMHVCRHTVQMQHENWICSAYMGWR